MDNRKILETLRICGGGSVKTNDNITDKLMESLSKYDIDFKKYLREVSELFSENAENIYVYGRILNNLDQLLNNLDDEDIDKMLDDYIKFLRTYNKLRGIRDIKELSNYGKRMSLEKLSGFKALKILDIRDKQILYVGDTKYTIEYIEDTINYKNNTIKINGINNSRCAIFIKDNRLECFKINSLDDRVKVFKHIIKNSDSFDYVITPSIIGINGVEICDMCKLDTFNNKESMDFINLITYISDIDIIQKLRRSKNIELGKMFLEMQSLTGLYADCSIKMIYTFSKLKHTKQDEVKFLELFKNRCITEDEYQLSYVGHINDQLTKICDKALNDKMDIKEFIRKIKDVIDEGY